MSDRVGPIRVLRPSSEGYLGADSAVMDAVSSETMQEFDHEVKRLIELAERRAAFLLEKNRDQLDQLVARLQEEETLEASALESVLMRVTAQPELLDKEDGPQTAGNGAAKPTRSTRTTRL